MLDPRQVDDETILDSDVLWRRVPDWPHFIAFDKLRGHYRVTSSAFDDDRDGDPMSVFLAKDTSAESVLSGHEGFGIADGQKTRYFGLLSSAWRSIFRTLAA